MTDPSTAPAKLASPTAQEHAAEVLKNPQWPIPRSILITECAQEDFLKLLGKGESSPTLVHVGRHEAERLCGPAGTLIDFLVLANQSKAEEVGIIHICDEHDPIRDKEHLERFGRHGVRDTPGAKLVGTLDDLAAARPNTFKVEAGDLNDLHETNIVKVLKGLLEGRDPSEIKFGVVGVWTDVKVSYLIRDLITELGVKQVATCSSLTASSDIENHYSALTHLKEVLGVKVFHSHIGMLRWLNPSAEIPIPEGTFDNISYNSEDRCPGLLSKEQLKERDTLIAASLESVLPTQDWTLKPLSGGFSGSQVFVAKTEGKVVVAKVGPRDEIAHERFANERMVRKLRGFAPGILAYREGPGMAVIIQELAQPRSAEVQGPVTFQEVAQKDPRPEVTELLKSSLETVFDRALAGTLNSGSLATADLFREFGFTNAKGEAQYTSSVVKKAFGIYRKNGYETAEDFFKHLGLKGNICSPQDFYLSWLPGKTMIRDTFKTDVHGDLNLVNVLLTKVDGATKPENLWLIDFARLSKLPSLTDFAKIENDLSYIVLPIRNTDEFKRALALQEARLSSPTLDLSGIEKLATTAEEIRYVELLKKLRSLAKDIDARGEEAMEGYRVALLRYAAHTLGFTEPNHAQLSLALCGVGRLAGMIKDSNSPKMVES